ncbi:MAG: DUF2807 domain-containing protein [bacterium]|nr:DUF2807 domain-containing protein [bacterium]
MTSDDLNQLFASAREIPVETAPEQIAGWVGASAAASTGVLGIAAKLKLLIAKKTFIIMGTILSVTSLGIVLTMSLNTQDPQSSPSEKVHFSEIILDDHVQKEEPKAIQILFEDTTLPSQKIKESPHATPTSIPLAEPTTLDSPKGVMAPRRGSKVAKRYKASLAPQLQVSRSYQAPKAKKDKNPELKGDGNVTKVDRKVGSFKEIEINGVIDVILTQGNQEKVVIETDSNLQEQIETEVSGELLIISTKKGSMKKVTKMIAHVTVKDLSKIKNSGVGDITCENAIKSNSLELDVNNVGDIDLQLDCVALEVDFRGVGDLKLEGTAKTATVKSSGVGNIKAYGLDVATMKMKHTGVGNALIYVSEDLTLKYSGVGNVNYKGNPKKKDIKKSGVGSVKNKS